jgi:hypothetical protein
MQRIWIKRQAQIERVTDSMVGVVGELQAMLMMHCHSLML